MSKIKSLFFFIMIFLISSSRVLAQPTKDYFYDLEKIPIGSVLPSYIKTEAFSALHEDTKITFQFESERFSMPHTIKVSVDGIVFYKKITIPQKLQKMYLDIMSSLGEPDSISKADKSTSVFVFSNLGQIYVIHETTGSILSVTYFEPLESSIQEEILSNYEKSQKSSDPNNIKININKSSESDYFDDNSKQFLNIAYFSGTSFFVFIIILIVIVKKREQKKLNQQTAGMEN